MSASDVARAVSEAQAYLPDDAELVAELAALPRLEYERRREETAERLGVRVTALDAEVAAARTASGVGEAQDAGLLRSWMVEPWPAPVEGSELLGELARVYRRHVVLPRHGAETMALWTMHAWTHDAASVSPLLVFGSPEKRCGKTTALLLLRYTTPRPLPAANVTAAVLFRAIERWHPSVLVDEADTFLGEDDELRGIINSGHVRRLAQTIRCVGDDHEPRTFSTWAPKAIALIGRLHDTLRDRAIVLEMRRRLPSERIERLRGDRDEDFLELRRRAARWAADSAGALDGADPDIPDGLADRAADNWRALFAIAHLADGEWPQRAREAALALSGESRTDTDSVRTLLLGDLRQAFEDLGPRVTSATLAERLGAMEERPWPEWHRGRPITVRQIASLLRPFGIEPTTIRAGDDRGKGYKLEDCSDAFGRYLPAIRDIGDNRHGAGVSRPCGSVTPGGMSRIEDGREGASDAACHRVTDGEGDDGRGQREVWEI